MRTVARRRSEHVQRLRQGGPRPRRRVPLGQSATRRPRRQIRRSRRVSGRPRRQIRRLKRVLGGLDAEFSGCDRLPAGAVTTGSLCRRLLAARARPAIFAAGFRAAQDAIQRSKRRQGGFDAEFQHLETPPRRARRRIQPLELRRGRKALSRRRARAAREPGHRAPRGASSSRIRRPNAWGWRGEPRAMRRREPRIEAMFAAQTPRANERARGPAPDRASARTSARFRRLRCPALTGRATLSSARGRSGCGSSA